MKSYFFIVCFFISSFPLFAQEKDDAVKEYLIVKDFEIEGNKRTKEAYMLRELNIEKGDTILLQNLPTVLEQNIALLYSADIFSSVKMDTFALEPPFVKIKITITEGLSIIPIPNFKLVDRNFNVWWNQFNHDLSRTIWGIYVQKKNLRGQNEKLIVQALWGFSRIVDVQYNFPYINRDKTMGLYVRSRLVANREIAYQTFNNKEQFYRHNDHSNRNFKLDVTLKRRKEIKHTHYAKFIAERSSVADSLGLLNPQYFKNAATKQAYLALRYAYEFNTRDIVQYPLKGFYFRGELNKNGLGIFKDLNTFVARINASYFRPITETLFVASNLRLSNTWGKDQPYYNGNRLGYLGFTPRGYEFYALDNQQHLLWRSNIRWRIWAIELPDPFYVKTKKKMSFKGYLRAHYETAYAKDDLFNGFNSLNNTWLQGTGLALDLVFWETVPVSLEYNWNHLNERGFYFHLGLEWDDWPRF